MMKLPKLQIRFKPRQVVPRKWDGLTQPKNDAATVEAPRSSLSWRRVTLAVLTILLLSVMMSVNLLPDRISLRLGETAPREVRSRVGRPVHIIPVGYRGWPHEQLKPLN